MRKILVTLLALAAAAVLAGCGSSNHIKAPANPTGGNDVGFTNADLNGTYVFSANGVVTKAYFAVAGIFTADGNGGISSGTQDTVYDSGKQKLNDSISSGSYAINSDGRGQLILKGGSGTAIYRLVLTSPTSGQFFQVGANSSAVVMDAVGSFTLQSATASALATGTYIVGVNGEDSKLRPYAAVGALTVSGNSFSTAASSIDENDSGAATPFSHLPLTAGSYQFTSGSRGTATITTANGTHNFVFYYASPNLLEMVGSDSKFFLYGQAKLQTSTADSNALFLGDQVFNVAGIESSSAIPVQETGRLTLSGGTTIDNGLADLNIAGVLDNNTLGALPILSTSTYNVDNPATGRWEAVLNYTGLASTGLVGWQVSPQESMLLVTSPTAPGDEVATGEMYAQNLASISTASITGNYAQSFSGFNTGFIGNYESVGSLAASPTVNCPNAGPTNLCGDLDWQTDGNGLSLNIPSMGSYTFDSTTGRGTGSIASTSVAYYATNPGNILTFSLVSTSIFQGTLVSQQP